MALDGVREYYPTRIVEGVCKECGHPLETPAIVAAGRVKMDRERMIVWLDGTETKALTPLEFEIFWRLVERGGRIAPYWYLQEDTTGHEHASGTIKTIIRYIRRKFGDDIIETRRGQGYRLRV